MFYHIDTFPPGFSLVFTVSTARHTTNHAQVRTRLQNTSAFCIVLRDCYGIQGSPYVGQRDAMEARRTLVLVWTHFGIGF